MAEASTIRKTVLFSGQVQGVGFRMTTKRIARKWPVTGTVRNLPNGQVEVVVEGEELAVDGFLAAVVDRMTGYVSGRESTTGAASGEWTAFSVVT